VFCIAAVSPAIVFKKPTPRRGNYSRMPEKIALPEIRLENPICKVRIENLSMVAMSALAEASYIVDYNQSGEIQMMDDMFRAFIGTDWKDYIKGKRVETELSWRHIKIWDFLYTRGGKNVHVISVEGTTNSVDAMADLELWFSSVVLNCLKATIPVFNGYGDDSRTFVGYAMHLPRYLFKNLSLVHGYCEIIYNYVQNLTAVEKSEIILTGHSLGGGLSKMVSLRTGYQAVAFSGPGITGIGGFYDWKDNHITESFINVVPNLDPAAAVDSLTGSSFMIPCESGLAECHNIYRTQCMLATLCGDIERPLLRQWCDWALTAEEVKKMIDLARPYTYTVSNEL
jgi:lipase ATG15